MQTESVIDCSGKILISGGYLILDENLSGLVICPTDATGRCTIKKVQNGRCRLEIYSENFRGTAIYEIDWSAPQAKQVSEGTTEFVDFAIKTVVQYLFESKVPTESFSSLNMNVYINPVFYGHQESSFKTLIKTGLGSSAVVTTLITRALLSSWLPESFVSDRLVFFLSYIAHSEAQGKLGSGFDIAASVFGSIIFKKFSVPADGRLFDRCQSFLSDSVLNFTPIKLKAGLVQGILVGNRCGSSTVSLVSTFLAWKKTHPAECRAFFNEIDIWTNRIAKAIAFEGTGSQSDASDEDLEAARVASRKIMTLYFALGVLCDTPIVPKELFQPCMDILDIPGVFCCEFPGAGGYDSICLIYRSCSNDALQGFLHRTPQLAGLKLVPLGSS